MCASCTERSAKTNFTAPFDHGDHHDVRDADAADEQRHSPKSEEQRCQCIVGSGLCLERIGWPADGDLFGVLRIGGCGQDVSRRIDCSVDDSRVHDRRIIASVVELDRSFLADEYRTI